MNDFQLQQAARAGRTRTAVLIVLEIARLTRRYGKATPSRAGMAKRIGVCERTISRNVIALERAEVLTVTRDTPHRRPDGTWTRARTSLYRLHMARKARSHRRDMGVPSKPLTGRAICGAPARNPVDNPQNAPPDGESRWHPRLVGLTWRDLVVTDG